LRDTNPDRFFRADQRVNLLDPQFGLHVGQTKLRGFEVGPIISLISFFPRPLKTTANSGVVNGRVPCRSRGAADGDLAHRWSAGDRALLRAERGWSYELSILDLGIALAETLLAPMPARVGSIPSALPAYPGQWHSCLGKAKS